MTSAEIREGLAAAVELRSVMVRYGLKLAMLGVGCGLLIVGAGYLSQGHVSAWALVFPIAIGAVCSYHPYIEARHFSKMVREFQIAERRAIVGETVYAREIPTLGRR